MKKKLKLYVDELTHPTVFSRVPTLYFRLLLMLTGATTGGCLTTFVWLLLGCFYEPLLILVIVYLFALAITILTMFMPLPNRRMVILPKSKLKAGRITKLQERYTILRTYEEDGNLVIIVNEKLDAKSDGGKEQ